VKGSSGFVEGDGPQPCVGMIVGIAPGAKEVQEGKPFVGPAGDTLNSALCAAGASRDSFYITNVYKLKTENNRNPTNDEIQDHARYLLDELKKVQPCVILLLGDIPQRTFGLLRAETLVATKHPAWVRRWGKQEDKARFCSDVKQFVRLVERCGRSSASGG
jgi:uracil-DNA glycosylase family 4